MREIKFRAWDEDGLMVNVARIDFSMAGKATLVWCLRDGKMLYGSLGSAIVALMQYTGLKDKNDKEIYEGDKVKTDEAGWVAQVVYRRDCFMLIGLDGAGFSLEPNWEECKVIGNIYENKNLLEDK